MFTPKLHFFKEKLGLFLEISERFCVLCCQILAFKDLDHHFLFEFIIIFLDLSQIFIHNSNFFTKLSYLINSMFKHILRFIDMLSHHFMSLFILISHCLNFIFTFLKLFPKIFNGLTLSLKLLLYCLNFFNLRTLSSHFILICTLLLLDVVR